MDVQMVYALAACLSAVSAILAWVAKLKWSKEYRAAKEAQIEQLKSQINQLQNMTPMMIEDYFNSMKRMLGENISYLEEQLRDKNQTDELNKSLQIEVRSLRTQLSQTESLSTDVHLWRSTSAPVGSVSSSEMREVERNHILRISQQAKVKNPRDKK